MKAALVNHRYYPFTGGSEIYIKVMAEWLVSRGVDARVITTNAWDLEYFWDPSASSVDAPPIETVNGVPVERLAVEHPPLSKLAFPVARRLMGEASRVTGWAAPFRAAGTFMPRVRGLEGAIAGGAPDVVIVTNLGLEGLALRAAGACRRSGAKLVVIPFAHLGSKEDARARRYVSMPHQRELLQEADLVLTLTDLERDFVIDMGVETQRAVTVGAGVRIEDVTGGYADRMRERIESPGPIIAAIGAQAADKGTRDLVEASSLLNQRGNRVQLVLIGPELSGFAGWMERRGVADWPWVHRLGMVDDGAKRDLLAAMDVLALPSRTESFGIVYLEAWANRKPVIAAKVGAATEIVKHDQDGLLTPFGDPPVLADTIQRLLDSPGERMRLGDAGHCKVKRLYTWEHVLRRIGSAFEQVLGLRLGGMDTE